MIFTFYVLCLLSWMVVLLLHTHTSWQKHKSMSGFTIPNGIMPCCTTWRQCSFTVLCLWWKTGQNVHGTVDFLLYKQTYHICYVFAGVGVSICRTVFYQDWTVFNESWWKNGECLVIMTNPSYSDGNLWHNNHLQLFHNTRFHLNTERWFGLLQRSHNMVPLHLHNLYIEKLDITKEAQHKMMAGKSVEV